MSSTLRNALVHAAHLIADAMEAERTEPARAAVKRAPKTPRKQNRKAYVPPKKELSEFDRARARAALKKAGLPVP